MAACSGDSDGGGVGGVRDDGDWISELLDEADKESDDSDEVVVVGEVIAKPKLRVAKSLVKRVNKVDDDDDECVVLDGNPDKPVAIDNDSGVDDSDELLVVSEKGQVACRDYPHARHLCFKFPFSSTPHDSHCDQCHCYVCDSLAPCLHWSTSISSIDHCHATDKDEFWKAQRKSSKKIEKISPVATGVPDTSFSTGLVPTLPSDPSLQNQLLFTQAAHQLSSMPTSNGTPNIATHGRRQQSGNYVRNKSEPHLISQQLRNTFSNVIPGDRRHGVGNTGTHFISRVPFKRTGKFGGVLPTNRYCKYSSTTSHGYQFPRSHPPAPRWLAPSGGVTPVMNTYQDTSKANVGSMANNLMSDLPAMANMVNGTANHAPSQPQIFPTCGSYVNTNTVGPQHQLSSQIYADFNFTNTMPTQPGVATQPNWDCPFDNSFPFQPQATSNPNDAGISQDPVPSETLVTSLGNMSNCFGTQSTLHASSPEFGFSWDSPTSHSKQPLVVEYNQLENALQRDEPVVNVDGGSQLPGSTSTSPLDFQFDPWIFEIQSALEVPVPPELNVFSPEATPIDAGAFFDF